MRVGRYRIIGTQPHTFIHLFPFQLCSVQPRMLLITCMDSRLCPTSFTQADPGDMFIVRNPGNIMPHNQLFGENHDSVLSERAALELAISSGVQHIAVCGHSDCKVTLLAWCYSNLMHPGVYASYTKSIMYCINDAKTSCYISAWNRLLDSQSLINSECNLKCHSLLERLIVWQKFWVKRTWDMILIIAESAGALDYRIINIIVAGTGRRHYWAPDKVWQCCHWG